MGHHTFFPPATLSDSGFISPPNTHHGGDKWCRSCGATLPLTENPSHYRVHPSPRGRVKAKDSLGKWDDGGRTASIAYARYGAEAARGQCRGTARTAEAGRRQGGGRARAAPWQRVCRANDAPWMRPGCARAVPNPPNFRRKIFPAAGGGDRRWWADGRSLAEVPTHTWWVAFAVGGRGGRPP